MVNIAYGCCVGSVEKFEANVRPRVGASDVWTLYDQKSIGEAYNRILAECAHHRESFDALVLLHDDLEMIDPLTHEKIMEALADPDVALVGVAGGRDIFGLAWWGATAVGHQRTDAGLIDFGTRIGEVQLVEGSFMVFSPWAIEHLRFDERFTGFHGYDDIGMVARAAGKKVVVADIDTHHHTMMGFKTPESAEAWGHADALFREKWGL